jgi:hypothetical protein
MPTKDKCYENYPGCMVFAVVLFSLATYLFGGYIIYQLGLFWLALYIVYILLLEYRLLGHCAECYYYGKWCAGGHGKLSCLFFKKSKKKFTNRKITWTSLLPDMLVSIVPILVGIWLLIGRFNWSSIGGFELSILISIILLFLLMTVGNAFMHGNIICKYCKQRQLGCPAEQLFAKKK